MQFYMASVDLQEKANFTRLSRLLVDKGTEALRNTFDGIHSPANLPVVLATNRISLLKLKPRVISDYQWDLLYPPSGNPPDSKTFDVTLLTVLFRNICGLPKTGWGAMPLDADRSMQANIVRMRLFRNEVYAHVASTQVDNATFESLWKKITQPLIELNIPQNVVDELKTCPLAPKEETYLATLKDWKLKEENLTNYVQSIDRNVTRLTQITEDGMKQLYQLSLEQVSKDTNPEICRSKVTDEDLLRKLAKHSFKSKIKNKLKFFLPGTREWLLKKVDDWFIGNECDIILLLTAGPGFGKSVFAAKVCADFKKEGKLAACHFCDFNDSNLRDPMMMLQSLASQMCENIVGFKEKLIDQLKRPHEVRNLKDAFGIYLQNPLDGLKVRERYLVVIDGLDESATEDKDEIVNLIADYFPDLPDCIKVLVTSRPEISVAKLKFVERVNIESNDADNNLDLALFLISCLQILPLYVIKRLVEKCEGSFLYAFYTQYELQKRGNLHKMTLNDINEFVPKGLDSIYYAYFKRLEHELKAIMRGNFDVLRVLEMLATSKAPLPLTFVTRALGLAPDCRETKNIIDKVNVTVSCLLYVSADVVTVFHKSVIDWLLANGYQDHEYTVNVRKGNEILWQVCEQVFEEIKLTVCSRHDLNLTEDVKYALDNGFQHLIACRMTERFFWLIDLAIVHVTLFVYPNDYSLFELWNEALSSAVVMSEELRARISWNVFEGHSAIGQSQMDPSSIYLQSVLTHSPKGYFGDNEKKLAKSLLSNVPRFVEFNYSQPEVIPLEHYRPSCPGTVITAVSVSKDMVMAAVAQYGGIIYVVSLTMLVELWQYSTEYIDISCCTFAPDDSFVLFGKLETALNIAEKREVPFFHRNKQIFTSCAFSSNGKRLVTSNGSTIIMLWDVAGQCLLSLLFAQVPINWCSFSSTGLFIIGNDQSKTRGPISGPWGSDRDDSWVDVAESFCVWNAITWQRCDKRNVHYHKLNAKNGRAFQNELCKRCSLSTLELACKPLVSSEIPYRTWSTGIYNGIECIFGFDEQSLSVVESTHFTTLAIYRHYIHYLFNFSSSSVVKEIGAIKNDLWLYGDAEGLITFRTLAPQTCPTKFLWSSFSPDGSRLATCTSDGYINIWNVNTREVEQRLKSNQSESPYACWWSNEDFLFVLFGFCDRISSLSKYMVDVNLKILISNNEQVSLGSLLDELVSLSEVLDFSEGFLIITCGETKPVKVINVNGVGGPGLVTLPGIEPKMSITVSPGGSFLFGGGIDKYYVWKRNTEEAGVYEAFSNRPGTCYYNHVSCFSDDSKVVVTCESKAAGIFKCGQIEVIQLDTGNHKIVTSCEYDKLFCINTRRLVIAASQQFVDIIDMDSGAPLEHSFQRYLSRRFLMQIKLSPNGTTLALPQINGDMEFLRLTIPSRSLLTSIKENSKKKFEWQAFLSLIKLHESHP